MDGREERNFLETNLSAAWQLWLEKFAVIGGGRGYIDAFSVARCFRWRARNERGLVGRLLLLEWQRFIPALAPLPSYFQVGRVQRIDAPQTRRDPPSLSPAFLLFRAPSRRASAAILFFLFVDGSMRSPILFFPPRC